MKILVYGAGVLGCNLARNLFHTGKDVTLLARGNWAEEIRKNGLRIKDQFSLRTSVSNIPDTCDFHLKGAGIADHPSLYLSQPSNQIDFHS